MTLAAVPKGPDPAGLSGAALDGLQLEQFQHDEKYHREISRLSVQDRLKHMALHFAKYAGNLAENSSDESIFRRIVTDVFIIATSSANILNVRLSDEISAEGVRLGSEALIEVDDVIRAVTISAGKMAAACEKMDHLEDFPFRPVIRAAIIDLLLSSLRICENRNWDIASLVHARLQPVKQKSIFHGRL